MPALRRKNSPASIWWLGTMNPSPPKISETTKHKRSWLWIALVLLIAVPVTVIVANELIFFGRIVHSVRKAVRDADAGFKRAKQTIDPEQLRAWALASKERWSGTNDWEIPKSEIPEYIRNLYPQPPNAVLLQNGVMFMWGGGFFAWTLDVGPTNYVAETNPERPKVFMWVPGIYYARESSLDLQ